MRTVSDYLAQTRSPEAALELTGRHRTQILSNLDPAVTQSVAVDYGAQGIRAVALVTGPTHTGMVDELWPPGPLRDSLAATTSAGRLAAPEEQARAAVFAALPGSSFLTGCALTVDGGATAGWNEMARTMLTLKAV